MPSRCLCGSGNAYAQCCQPFHLQQSKPATAEQLMRSRYVAYALELEDYLIKTWAKSARQGSIEFEEGLHWLRLEILWTEQGMPFDTSGKVAFKAYYQVAQEKGVMQEVSNFIRDENQDWVYLNGQVK